MWHTMFVLSYSCFTHVPVSSSKWGGLSANISVRIRVHYPVAEYFPFLLKEVARGENITKLEHRWTKPRT